MEEEQEEMRGVPGRKDRMQKLTVPKMDNFTKSAMFAAFSSDYF